MYMVLYMAFHVLALAWSPSRAQGLDKLFLRLPLLLVPISVIFIDPRQSMLHRLRWAFVISTSVISFFLLVRGVLIWFSGFGWPVYLTFSPFIHPAYLALAVGSSLFLLFGSGWMKDPSRFTAQIAAMVVLCITLMSLSSKAQILSVLAIGTVWAISVVRSKYGTWKTSALVAATVIIIVPLGYDQLMQNARMRQGVVELHNLEADDPDETSTGSRVILWRESAHHAMLQPWGYGTGHDKQVISERLVDIGRFRLAQKRPNTHNQYLGDVLSVGVQGCIALVLMLLLPAVSAWRYGVSGAVPVIALLAMSLLTESMLERQTGVALSAFLLTILTYRPSHAES